MLALKGLRWHEADVALAWVSSDLTVGGGLCTSLWRWLWLRQGRGHGQRHARGPLLLKAQRRIHHRAVASGLRPHAEGSDPQESRREHEAYGGSEAQSPQRKGPRVHGRGNDLLDKVH